MGRVRHIEVDQLWLQDKVASGEIKEASEIIIENFEKFKKEKNNDHIN